MEGVGESAVWVGWGGGGRGIFLFGLVWFGVIGLKLAGRADERAQHSQLLFCVFMFFFRRLNGWKAAFGAHGVLA